MESIETSQTKVSVHEASTCRNGDEEYANVDWDNLGFALNPADYMYIMISNNGEFFEQGHICRYGNIEISPAGGVLNYGQGVFEGMKVYRKADGRLLLFRPDENAKRMITGAERMCMPSPSVDQFTEAVKQIALANKHWVPPTGKGSLYLRPLLIGTGPVLGLTPSPEYTFLIYASPVGNYFKEGSAPLSLYVEDEIPRASQGGTGGIKATSNYAPVYKAITKAQTKGYSDVIYLDAVHKKYIEEVSSSNIFVLKGNVLSTPAIIGTILNGVTRKSILEIALKRGYEVEERSVAVEELMDADEVFCTGTAVVVAGVGSITYKDQRVEYKINDKSISGELYRALVGIQTGLLEDKMGWTVEIS